MQKLMFYTSAGDMEVCRNVNEFIKHLAIHKVPEDQDSIRIYKRNVGDEVFNPVGFPTPASSSYEDSVVRLKRKEPKEILIDKDDIPPEVLNRLSVDRESTLTALAEYMSHEHTLREITPYIRDKIFYHVSKKKPEFFKKDLGSEEIHDLSNTYLMNWGSKNVLGFHVELSANQKFFMIADLEAFRVYLRKKSEMFLKPVTHFGRTELVLYLDLAVELVEMAPTKWCIGRFDNPKYLQEIEENRRYAGR